ncbi:peroxisomal NADH pyrophosphatase NUDT12 [Magnaporthiopsis poae ATCC 64411]|uniref:Peroxisomal NADH pyrophosphatase NUDT12 n=1 Tax=Magnaporthiopsis poae (strain ATCC 64411 / 73-15) TaxID=644358 RepID=A0A0C4E1W5_MAGP6|nr:peroxisomal NADH pyrophosphatase NUDT12 [Magnaporthiopsis poae ATCC 64411]
MRGEPSSPWPAALLAGCITGRLHYWPAALLAGCITRDGRLLDFVLCGEELAVKRWVPIEELKRALEFGVSGLGQPPPEGYKEGDLRLPPDTAIANRLLTTVVEGYNGTFPKI